MDRPPRGFQLIRGRWSKGSELLAEPRLAELASHDGRLHPNAPLRVLEDEAMAMRPNHDPKTAANVMHAIPAPQLTRLKSRPEILPGPACKAVDDLVCFAVDDSLWNLFAVANPRPRPEGRQPELSLEGSGHGEELLVVPSGRMNSEGLRVDLVDRNADVLAIFVVVANGVVLVLGEAESIDEVFHNALELLRIQASILAMK